MIIYHIAGIYVGLSRQTSRIYKGRTRLEIIIQLIKDIKC